MPTVSDASYQGLINTATAALSESSDSPRIDAEIIMQFVVDQSLAWLIARGDSIALPLHTTHFFEAIAQRQKGLPVAYITGTRDFWSLTLKVNKHVLIPRPDTETLVEKALQHLPKDTQLRLLDLGTGSGAIALALAKERPLSSMLAVDLYSAALNVAKANAELNNVANVTFAESDWFAAIDEQDKFNLIASNPPYVEPDDPHLVQGDLRFEPDTALIANGKGLADLQHIVYTAPKFLKAGGHLIVEHGYNQANEVEKLFTDAGYQQIQGHRDLNDLPRCTSGVCVQV